MGTLCQDSDRSYEKISRQLDALMDELMGPQLTRLVSSQVWEPAWNIYEFGDRYVICVDLAGMRHEKIDVHVDRGTLRLSGFREKAGWNGEGHDACVVPSVQVMEIDWGRFERSFAIPPDADSSAVGAKYRNGYLWIELPKRSPQ